MGKIDMTVIPYTRHMKQIRGEYKRVHMDQTEHDI